ncbi:MAG: hypothetical protein QM804_10320 [Propionicimonas sp.]
MSGDRFEWNIAGLIDLSNEVLDADCIPIANEIASTARSIAPADTGEYRDSIHVETDKRTGVNDFAHAYVVADDPKAAIIEARKGILGRAIGGA